jgi:hypothetical protein
MFARSALVLAATAFTASAALAAGPVRTPSNYTVKDGQPAQQGYVFLDNTFSWDANSFVRTQFTDKPAIAPLSTRFDFLHAHNGASSRMQLTSQPSGGPGSLHNAQVTFQRVAPGTNVNSATTSGPTNDGNQLLYQYDDGQIMARMFFHSTNAGYNAFVTGPNYYGQHGFTNPNTGEGGLGAFAAGMTTFRFVDEDQNAGRSRLRYMLVNEGGENGLLRVRLTYVDRLGADGYNKIRFNYVAQPGKPVSPH